MIIASIKRISAVGKHKQKMTDEGGILPSVILLLLLFSLILSYELSSYRQEITIYQQTKDHYQGKTLERLTLARLQQRVAEESFSGEDRYNIGKVSYLVEGTAIELIVTLESGFSYVAQLSRNK